MKKFLSTIFAGLLFGMMLFPFAACSEVDESSITEVKELRFDIQVNYVAEPQTKAVKVAWEAGDKMYVFFREGSTNYLDATKYVILTYNGTSWDGAASPALTDASELGSSGRMYGIYFPYGDVRIASDGDNGVTFRTKHTNPALDNLPIYTYYAYGRTNYSISTLGDVATLAGSIDLSVPADYVYFFVDKSGSDYCVDDKYRLAVEGVCPVACASFKNGSFFESDMNGKYMGQPMWGYKYGDNGIAFTGKIDNSWTIGTSHKFTFFSDGDPAMSRTMVISDETPMKSHVTVNLRAPIAANGWAQAVPTPSTTTLNGVKWADWNLGASNVSELGYYLQWGVLVVPKDYNKNNVLISGIGSNSLTGNYAIYDAARAYLGSPWRMPTKSELAGLGSITDDNWIPVGNTTIQVGPTGTEFTPSPTLKNGGWKVEKSGASIFLPVCGFYDKVDTLNEIYENHSTGCYWSSNADASYLHFYNIPSGSKWANTATPGYREYGMQVRPIKGE